MADYFPVLSRAVAGLETNTEDNRKAVYDRARAAIVRQLRSIDPPLAEDAIEREQTQLEEAIGRVEAGAPRAEPAPAAPSPPAAGAEAAARADASARRAPPRAAAANTQDRADAPRAADAPAPKAERRPTTRADGRPILRAAGESANPPAKGRSGALVALAALAVIAVAAAAFATRSQIAELVGLGSPSPSEVAVNDDAPPSPSPPAEAPTASPPENKDDDRLLSDPPAAAPPAQAPESEIARAPAENPQPAEPAAPLAPPTTPAPDAGAAPQPGPLVAQRATLYEEGADQQSGDQVQGAVVWRTESVSGGQNQPLETALRGDIDIPGRGIKATLSIRRNADATLPASHTIEIQFTLPENFSNAGIANVPGLLMKADEAARGVAVSGLSVRVTSGFFLIGLSNLENERALNEQLLRDRSWIDIPILYDNGRRAVLTLEKGTPGAQAFTDAFAAWQSASTARP